MGRLIDCNDVYNAIQITTDNFGVAKSVVENNMLTMLSKIETVEAIPKADYENRLKADMVAMLEDLSREINPIKECEQQIFGKESWNFVGKCQDVIQSKIDKLKGDRRWK